MAMLVSHQCAQENKYLLTTVRSKFKRLLINGLMERFLKIPMVTKVFLLNSMMAICKTV